MTVGGGGGGEGGEGGGCRARVREQWWSRRNGKGSPLSLDSKR